MICISFDSCGWMYFFHLGVARYLYESMDCKRICFAGSSAGSFIALCLCVGIPIDTMVRESIQNLELYRWNPFNICTYLENTLLRILPNDAYQICDRRLFISVTEYTNRSFQNRMISTFTSNRELIDVVIASCYIPPFAGLRLYKGKFLDGGFSCKLLKPMPQTIRVSASGRRESEIRNSIFFPITIGMFPPFFRRLTEMERLGYLEACHYFLPSSERSQTQLVYYRQQIYYYNIYRIVFLLFLSYCITRCFTRRRFIPTF